MTTTQQLLELFGASAGSAEHGRLLTVLRHVDAARTPVVVVAYRLLEECGDALPARTAVELSRPAEAAYSRDQVLVVDTRRETSSLVWAGDLPAFLSGRRGEVLRVIPGVAR